KAQEQAAVPSLGPGELQVEGAQLRLRQVLRKELQALAAAQLDQRRDEQAVEQPLRPRLPDVRLQCLRVRIAWVAPQLEAALLQQCQHLGQVPGLLARQPRHRARQPGHLGKSDQQGKGVRGRLLLAVSMIDQDLVEPFDGEAHPGGGRGEEQLHGGLLCTADGRAARRSATLPACASASSPTPTASCGPRWWLRSRASTTSCTAGTLAARAS